LKEINAMVAPSEKDVKIVTRWLKTFGFQKFKLSKSGDLLSLVGTPDMINNAFNTDMELWENKEMKRQIYRALTPYSLPKHVADKIDLVSGIHHFPTALKPIISNTESSYLIGPTDLRTRYNVTDFASGNANNTQAVAEFQGQYYSPSDLDTFFTRFVPGDKSSKVAGVIGGDQPQDPGIEASLDIQYIMGVNPGTASYFYEQVGGLLRLLFIFYYYCFFRPRTNSSRIC
jgi:tripeptidyl-peptidase-1